MDRLILPDAPWRGQPGLRQLAALLGADHARFVGGAVRDTLLGLPVADVDIATPLDPAAVIERLRAGGVKVVPTGIAHGTVTAVLPDGPVEVTTLRRDVETDGRHATVEFSADWREDAARRDFTINALYADPLSGEVFDYFGGLADLSIGRLRFIGDPLQRIAEDHLRILRFFRFHARFGDTPDAAGLAACAARANDLMALSRERIASELLKLLVTRGAAETVTLMLRHAILAPVLPEIVSADRLSHLIAREGAAALAPDRIRRLAALLPRDPNVADGVAARLKLSNADRKRLVAAVEPMPEIGWQELGYRLGRDGAIDRLLLSEVSDGPATAARLARWSRPQLPIGGGALVARGIGKGPDVARLLHEIEDRWIMEDFPDTARVEAIADQVVASWLRSARNA